MLRRNDTLINLTSAPAPGLSGSPLSIFAFGRFRLDTERQVLLADGRPLALRGRPIQILSLLAANADRVVGVDEIVGEVWKGLSVGENNLPVQMSILRRCLRAHGAEDLIVTLPNRGGYKLAGPVADAAAFCTCEEAAPAGTPAPGSVLVPAPHAVEQPAVPASRDVSARRNWRAWGGMGAAGAAAAAIVILAFSEPPAPVQFAAHVQVETKPDMIVMEPGGYCFVDYEFRLTDSVEMQLATEDMRFSLTSGEPVSASSVRGRIYHGSFPIKAPGRGVYHNNIYLPAAVVATARANGKQDVYLRHVFHLIDPAGKEVDVPAVLQIVFGSRAEACTPVK